MPKFLDLIKFIDTDGKEKTVAGSIQDGILFKPNLTITGNDTAFKFNSDTPGVTNGVDFNCRGFGADESGAVALGLPSYAHGEGSFTFGKRNAALHNQALAGGQGTRALGKYSTSLGGGTIVTSNYGFVAGDKNLNMGCMSLVSGTTNIISGFSTIAFGKNNREAYFCYDSQMKCLYLTCAKFSNTMSLPSSDSDINTKDDYSILIAKGEIKNNDDENVGDTLEYNGEKFTFAEDYYKNKCIYINGGGKDQKVARYVQSVNLRYYAFAINDVYKNQPAYNIMNGENNSIGYASERNIINGNNNKTSEVTSSIISGNYNKAMGSGNIISGYNNTIDMNNANYSIVSGYLNTCSHSYSYLFGVGLVSSQQWGSLAIGKYNSVNNNAVFQIGGGTSNTDRKSFMTVTNTGTVTITKVPGSAYEVLRYGDIFKTTKDSQGNNVTFGEANFKAVKATSFTGKLIGTADKAIEITTKPSFSIKTGIPINKDIILSVGGQTSDPFTVPYADVSKSYVSEEGWIAPISEISKKLTFEIEAGTVIANKAVNYVLSDGSSKNIADTIDGILSGDSTDIVIQKSVNAQNVTDTINGKKISDIFDNDGKTVQNAIYSRGAGNAESAEIAVHANSAGHANSANSATLAEKYYDDNYNQEYYIKDIGPNIEASLVNGDIVVDSAVNASYAGFATEAENYHDGQTQLSIAAMINSKANVQSGYSSSYTVLYGYVSGDTLYVLED